MIDGLKPYPEYRDSDLPWLGQHPAHWELRRMKVLFQERIQKGYPKEPLLAATQTKGVVKKEDYGNRTVTAQKDLHLLKLVEVGDYVISLRSFQGGIEVAHQRGIISPAYTVLKPSQGADSRYFSYFFKSKQFIDSLSLFITGIREGQNIDYARLSRAEMPLPPVDEQAAIVKFLDHATGRLNRAIRAKQKVIALMNEQKKVIIHRTVTRGLDPNVPLRPSGIPQLGDIPMHWELFPLKSLCTIQSGITLGKYYIGQLLTEYPYLRVANVQAGHLNLGILKTLRLPAHEASRSLLEIGDVLMTEGGDPDKLGRGCVWEGEISPCLHQNHIFAVRPDVKKLLPKYLSAVLGSDYAKNYFLATAKQTTNLASTNKTTIGRFRIPLPELSEQDSILSRIEEDTLPVTHAISRNERQISLLQEYRTRLIADVVTGKLDVRKVAAQLPVDSRVDESALPQGEPSCEYDELNSGLTGSLEMDEIDTKVLE